MVGSFPRLPRPHRERPRRRRAAEQRDELAAFQLIKLHSIPASLGRFAGYRMGRDQSAGIGVWPSQSQLRGRRSRNEVE
jgi:hypothetical protein